MLETVSRRMAYICTHTHTQTYIRYKNKYTNIYKHIHIYNFFHLLGEMIKWNGPLHGTEEVTSLHYDTASDLLPHSR